MALDNKNQSYRSANIVFIVLFFISVFLIFSRLTPVVKTIKSFLYYLFIPTIEFSSESLNSGSNIFFNLTDIVRRDQENIMLKKQILSLSDKLRDYNVLVNDNFRLKQLMKIPVDKNTTAVFANVIVREPSEWYQWLIINKGTADGLKQDMAVVSIMPDGRSCALGRIIEVYDTTSKVALLTNSLSAGPVQVAGSDIDCLVEGRNTQNLKLTYVPMFAELAIGDEVLTSPLSAIFNSGIAVGKIIEISKNTSYEYQEVTVMPYTQMQRIYEVAVIMPKEEII